MRVADTSALYALFSENDVHHEEATRALRDPEPVLVPDRDVDLSDFPTFEDPDVMVSERQGRGRVRIVGW